MSLEDRLLETDKHFEELKAERQGHLNEANRLWDEMMRVQGQYKLLQELDADEKASKVIKANKKAATIEAVPEE